jgi:hypothetical protein
MLLFAIPVDIPMLIAAARPTQPAWLNQNRLRRTLYYPVARVVTGLLRHYRRLIVPTISRIAAGCDRPGPHYRRLMQQNAT